MYDKFKVVLCKLLWKVLSIPALTHYILSSFFEIAAHTYVYTYILWNFNTIL